MSNLPQNKSPKQKDDCIVASIDVGSRKAGIVIMKQNKDKSMIRILFMSLIDFFPTVTPTFESLEAKYRCFELFGQDDDSQVDQKMTHIHEEFDQIESKLKLWKKSNKVNSSIPLPSELAKHQSLGHQKQSRYEKFVLTHWFGPEEEDSTKPVPPNSNALMIGITEVLKVYVEYWAACFGALDVVAIEKQPTALTEIGSLIQYCMAGFFAAWRPTPLFSYTLTCFIDAHNKLKIYYLNSEDKKNLMNHKLYTAKYWNMLVKNDQMLLPDLVCLTQPVKPKIAPQALPSYWNTHWMDRGKNKKMKKEEVDSKDEMIDLSALDVDQDDEVETNVTPNPKKRARYLTGRFQYAKGDQGKHNQDIRIENKKEALRRWSMILDDRRIISGQRWILRWKLLYNNIDKRDCADAGLQALYTFYLYWNAHDQKGKKSKHVNPVADLIAYRQSIRHETEKDMLKI